MVMGMCNDLSIYSMFFDSDNNEEVTESSDSSREDSSRGTTEESGTGETERSSENETDSLPQEESEVSQGEKLGTDFEESGERDELREDGDSSIDESEVDGRESETTDKSGDNESNQTEFSSESTETVNNYTSVSENNIYCTDINKNTVSIFLLGAVVGVLLCIVLFNRIKAV